MVRVHSPSPPLAPFVETLWYDDGYRPARHREHILPGGHFTIVIDLGSGPGVVIGMRSRYIEVDTTPIHSVMGVVFRPGGARPFFDAPSDEFYNQVLTLDHLWGCGAQGLRDRLLETTSVTRKFRLLESELLRRMQSVFHLHPAVVYGLSEFQCAPHVGSVREVTTDAGLSRRRFGQLFREQIGMTPKLYCRLHRFWRVMGLVASRKTVNWADVAIAGGYSDQAHLSHEFRDFAGLSPGKLFAAERPACAHVRVD